MADSLIRVNEPVTYFKNQTIKSSTYKKMVFCVLKGQLKAVETNLTFGAGDTVEIKRNGKESLLILEESTLIEIEGNNLDYISNHQLSEKILESATNYIREMRDYLYKK